MAGCRHQSGGLTAAGGAAGPPRKPQVIIGQPLKLNIVEWDQYIGRLEAVETVEVRARVSGYLEAADFAEGQIVKAGDVLAVIDRRPFAAELKRTEALLNEARAALGTAEALIAQREADQRAASIRQELTRTRVERTRGLRTQNVSTQEELDLREAEYAEAQANVIAAKAAVESAKASLASAKAAIETAEANQALAQLNLDYTMVVAPITGRVSRRYVTEGNLISGGSNQGTLITTIVSLNPIHVYFDADEQAFLKYMRLAQEGTRKSSREYRNPVYAALSDEPNGYPHVGHMDFVENRLDQETGSIRGRAIIPNPDFAMSPGLFARIRLPGSARHEVLLVPDRAIGTDQSDKFVFVVDSAGKTERRVVRLGPISHGLRIVREGLTGSEQIILRGLQRVRPGMEVETSVETVTAIDDGLPDEYEPVPADKWLTPPRIPAANVVDPASGNGTGQSPGKSNGRDANNASENSGPVNNASENKVPENKVPENQGPADAALNREGVSKPDDSPQGDPSALLDGDVSRPSRSDRADAGSTAREGARP